MQDLLFLIHQTKQCIRNNAGITNTSITNASTTNASITNTPYFALFLYTLPNDPLVYTTHFLSFWRLIFQFPTSILPSRTCSSAPLLVFKGWLEEERTLGLHGPFWNARKMELESKLDSIRIHMIPKKRKLVKQKKWNGTSESN